MSKGLRVDTLLFQSRITIKPHYQLTDARVTPPPLLHPPTRQDCEVQKSWAAENLSRCEYNSRKQAQHLSNCHSKSTYMLQVTQSIAHFAVHSMVHGDLKQKNIVMIGDRAVPIDLGMTRSVEEGEVDAPSLGGTDGYQPIESMAFPLYASEAYRTSYASDVFTLGVTIIEVLLTTDCLPMLASIGPMLAEMLRNMLCIDPAGRPAAAGVYVQLGGVVESLRLAVADSAASVVRVQRVKEDHDSEAYQCFTELQDLQTFVNLRKGLVKLVQGEDFLEEFVDDMGRYVEAWDAVGCYEELCPYVKSLAWQRVKDRDAIDKLLCGLDAAFSDLEAV